MWKLPEVQVDQLTPKPRVDVQAILTVLGRRERSYEKEGEILNLSKTDLRGAHLEEAIVTQEQINTARGDEKTKLPKDLETPEHWLKD